MPKMIRDLLERNDYTLDDLDIIVAHQANERIIDKAARDLEFPMEKMYLNISEYGNIILESCTNWRRTFAYNLNLQVMSYIDSSEGTNFSEMFAYDRQLACIEAVDTLKYENTYNMFLGCVYLVEPNAAQQTLILNGYEWTTGDECSDQPPCSGDTCLNFRVWDADAGMYAFKNFITLGELQYQVGRTHMGCGDGTQPDPDFGLQCTPDVDCPDCNTFNVYYGTGNIFDKFDVKGTSTLWDYYYYADPNHNHEEGIVDRVVVMDPLSMTMVHEVPTVTQDPGSADRAGFTSRMYLRTKADHYFDVMDTDTMAVVKTVDLVHHKPRAAGAYNKYRNLQLISGKDHPMVSVIRVDDDSVVATFGEVASGGISGNCGGNATGHSNWLDKDHFTLVDRYNDKISVYKISGEHCLETFEKTQDFIVPTACHSIDVDVADLSLSKTVFYAEIEGSAPYDAVDKPYGKDVRPQVWKLFFNSGTGELVQVGDPVFFDGVESDDMTHHYSINPEGTELWQPVCIDAKVHVIDLATMTVNKVHEAGLGAGHVNFSTQLNLAVTTNHFCQYVNIIDRDTDANKRVYINSDSETIGLFTQSHLNHISPDGLFFYIFATESGDFVEVDLTQKIVSRVVHTGGSPEQSTS